MATNPQIPPKARWYDFLGRQSIIQSLSQLLFGRSQGSNELAFHQINILMTFTFVFTFGFVLTWCDSSQPGTALMWAMACFMGGNAIGFLFGIPKTSQSGAPHRVAPGGTVNGTDKLTVPVLPVEADGPNYQQYVNTNLEDISDWLTKIIVGIKLIEFRQILEYFRKAAVTCSGGLGEQDQAKAIAIANAIIGYFSVFGVLHGYLYTRVMLSRALRVADEAALERLEKTVARVSSALMSPSVGIFGAQSCAYCGRGRHL